MKFIFILLLCAIATITVAFRPQLFTRSFKSSQIVQLQSSWDDGALGDNLMGGSTSASEDGGGIVIEKKTVFVGNLPFEMTAEDIVELVEGKGVTKDDIVSQRVALDRRTGRSRGFGYLEFADEQKAADVVELLNREDTFVADRKVKFDIDISKDGPRKGRRTGRTHSEFSLFIGNLDYGLNQDNIQEFIMSEMKFAAESAGEEMPETEIRVRLKTDFGRSKGYGHIDFADEETRDKALKALQFKELAGRQLSVDLARGFRKEGEERSERGDRPPRERRPSNRFSIFLGNLSWDVMKEDIEDMVNDLMGEGRMTSVRMAVDKFTGRPRGYCHIDFSNEEDQEKAIGIFNGLEFFGRVMRADYATESRPRTAGPREGGRDNYNNRNGGGGGYGGDRDYGNKRDGNDFGGSGDDFGSEE